MSSKSTDVHNMERQRFEVVEGPLMARLTYSIEGEVIDLQNTTVPPELEGRGIASALAAAALRYATDQGLVVRASCPYVKAYMERHPSSAKFTERRDD
jgi:predicted GNAT family acetyltransferase